MDRRSADLYAGLGGWTEGLQTSMRAWGGWTEGLLAEGYDVTGYDIEAHEYDGEKYPARLVLQDVLTLDGAQFKDAALIVASPPCQEFSYMAMPWSRAKQIARALRGEGEFPPGYKGSRTIPELTALFDACFRIQREASAAAGRPIPLVVENVRGAEPWVGKARWSFGSYYLWGDVPALMPRALSQKIAIDPSRHFSDGSLLAHAHVGEGINGAHGTGGSHWTNPAERDVRPLDGRKNPGFRFDGSGKSFQSESVARHVEGGKVPSDGPRRTEPGTGARFTSDDGRKQPGIGGPRDNGKGDAWFQNGAARHGSKSPARKAASARIAKIPLALSQWIAKTYKPLPLMAERMKEAGLV